MNDEVASHIGAILACVADLKQQVADGRLQLAAIQQSLADMTQELEVQKDTLDAQKKTTAQEVSKLQGEIRKYTKDVDRLHDEVAGLVRRKGEVQVETAKLEQRNQEFKRYEEKAWKALRAKDEDLAARERNVKQHEATVPAAQSFLPPM